MRRLSIVGLGPGAREHVPEANVRRLRQSDVVFLRTAEHPSVSLLDEAGIRYASFDYLYDRCGTFEEVYRGICEEVLNATRQGADVAYCVPGHPCFGETTVQMLFSRLRGEGIPYEVLPAMSFLDAVCVALELDPSQGFEILDGCSMERAVLTGANGLVITQVFNRKTASDVKLALMMRYPDDHLVAIVRSAGIPGDEGVEWLPLYELDRRDVDHLTTVYVPPVVSGDAPPERPARWPLDPLMRVVNRLRGEGGCPWDREQTHLTLRPYVIEEAYEVVEAITMGDVNKLCEELGDLLLQVALHSRIAQEEGLFSINDVVEGVARKMIRRHAHVFGGARVATSSEVLDRWDAIKDAERGGKRRGVLDVPQGLPSLMRAYKIQKAAARVGFDWRHVGEVASKVEEELRELREAIRSGQKKEIENEVGDLLFSVVNLARFLKIDPEVALTGANSRFADRFGYIEDQASRLGKRLSDMSLEEMDQLWEESKRNQS